MKFNTLTRRAAAAGGATALAAGALVGLTATSASATTQPATNNYTCTAPTTSGTQTFPVTVTSDAPNLAGFPTYAAGASIPAAIEVTNHFVIPTAVKQLFVDNSVDNVTLPDIGALFSGTAVLVGETSADGVSLAPFALVSDMTASATPGFSEFNADGMNKALTAPKAGVYQLLMPTTFHVNANNGSTTLTQATCTLTDTANSLHDITLLKNDSVTKGSSNSPVKHGAKAVLKAKVTSAITRKPTGTVTFKEGTKKLGSATLKKGVATLSKTLSKGKHKIKAYYGGDSYTKKSTSAVFTVTQK